MCGIAGLISAGGDADAAAVLAMVRELTHRGPDGVGVVARGGVAIGCARLSITGAEVFAVPVAEPDGARVLAFNGEIYGLELPGEMSDTHWLLERLRRNGSSPLPELDGMYAVAVGDLDAERLTLARDAFGIKPLHLRRTDGAVAFASELEPLWRLAPEAPVVDADALLEYLLLGSRLGPETPFPTIASVEPASSVTIERRGGALRISEAAAPPAEATAEDLAAAIRASVVACARTTRPLGLFLSGGIDSTAIAAILSEAGFEGIHTFSLLLGDDGVRILAELDLPGAAWRTWKHHTWAPDARAVQDAVETVLGFTSQPCFPSSAAFTYMLAAMAADAGVRVVVSGEGADELFGGYESYVEFARAGAPSVEAFYLGSAAVDAALRIVSGAEDALERLRARLAAAAPDPSGDVLDALLLVERRLSLAPLLARLDETSMRHSIEVRVPYLHGAVPVLAGALRPSGDELSRRTKPVLRAAVADLVGDGRADEPKRPLRVPLEQWFRGSVPARVAAAVEDHRLPLDVPALRDWLAGVERRRDPGELLLVSRLYQLIRFGERFGQSTSDR